MKNHQANTNPSAWQLPQGYSPAQMFAQQQQLQYISQMFPQQQFFDQYQYYGPSLSPQSAGFFPVPNRGYPEYMNGRFPGQFQGPAVGPTMETMQFQPAAQIRSQNEQPQNGNQTCVEPQETLIKENGQRADFAPVHSYVQKTDGLIIKFDVSPLPFSYNNFSQLSQYEAYPNFMYPAMRNYPRYFSYAFEQPIMPPEMLQNLPQQPYAYQPFIHEFPQHMAINQRQFAPQVMQQIPMQNEIQSERPVLPAEQPLPVYPEKEKNDFFERRILNDQLSDQKEAEDLYGVSTKLQNEQSDSRCLEDHKEIILPTFRQLKKQENPADQLYVNPAVIDSEAQVKPSVIPPQNKQSPLGSETHSKNEQKNMHFPPAQHQFSAYLQQFGQSSSIPLIKSAFEGTSKEPSFQQVADKEHFPLKTNLEVTVPNSTQKHHKIHKTKIEEDLRRLSKTGYRKNRSLGIMKFHKFSKTNDNQARPYSDYPAAINSKDQKVSQHLFSQIASHKLINVPDLQVNGSQMKISFSTPRGFRAESSTVMSVPKHLESVLKPIYDFQKSDQELGFKKLKDPSLSKQQNLMQQFVPLNFYSTTDLQKLNQMELSKFPRFWNKTITQQPRPFSKVYMQNKGLYQEQTHLETFDYSGKIIQNGPDGDYPNQMDNIDEEGDDDSSYK